MAALVDDWLLQQEKNEFEGSREKTSDEVFQHRLPVYGIVDILLGTRNKGYEKR